MKTIGEILAEKPQVKGSERNAVINEIYAFYSKDKTSRRIENWKRYVNWLKENRKPNNPESQNLFKKSILFIKELPVKVIAIKLSHIPTNDLYYVKSMCVDKANRHESVGAFLLGSIKIKKE